MRNFNTSTINEIYNTSNIHTSNRSSVGSVSSSQPMFALFFSPPDNPLTSSLPITTWDMIHEPIDFHAITPVPNSAQSYSLVFWQSLRCKMSIISSTLASFSFKLNSRGSLNRAEYCKVRGPNDSQPINYYATGHIPCHWTTYMHIPWHWVLLTLIVSFSVRLGKKISACST